MDGATLIINDFLGPDPLSGEAALRDLVALGDAGEEALFGEIRPYPDLRQHQRRWLRYVSTRERTVLDRLLMILNGDGKGFNRGSAAFLLAGVSDADRARNGVFAALERGFAPDGGPRSELLNDHKRYSALLEAWGHAGGSAGFAWNNVSASAFAWEKLSTFAFRAGCASFARVNGDDDSALKQFVMHTLYDRDLVEITARPGDPIPGKAIDSGELWLQAYRNFAIWRRGEVADVVLRHWSTHDHWRVRSFGASVLAALGFGRIVAPTASWLRRESVTEVRNGLLIALARSGTTEGADVLLEHLEEGPPDRPGAAARAIWRAGDKDRARRALLQLPEESWEPHAERLVSLARLGQRHPRLAEQLDSPQPYVRLCAALAHAYLGDQAIRPRLAAMRGEAAGGFESAFLAAALAILGEPGAGPVLHRALVAASAETDFTRSADPYDWHAFLQEAVLAGLASSGGENDPLLEVWRTEFTPFDPICRPVAPVVPSDGKMPPLLPSVHPPVAKTGGPRREPLRIFISYSHQDEQMRMRLGQHLAPMTLQGLISIWHDREIEPAADWEGEINRKIQEADVVLLLVSASFISSPFCQKELRDALDLRDRRKCLAVPIILKPCDWEQVFNLPDYKAQALPRDNRSVSGGKWKNHDAAFTTVARELRVLFERIRKDDKPT